MKDFLKKYKKIVLSLLAVAIIGVGGTFAYLLAESGIVRNTFASGPVETGIEEEVSGSQKDVAVRNEGTLPVYVRVRALAGGAAEGKIAFRESLPAGWEESDMVYVLVTTGGWLAGGEETGYSNWYYYLTYLEKGTSTEQTLRFNVYIGSRAKVDQKHVTLTVFQEGVAADIKDAGDSSKLEINPELSELEAAFARH